MVETKIPHTDLVGYDSLVEFLAGQRIGQIDGDFLEIGCFLGGGTAKLAQLATALRKKVWVVDIFDPNFDETRNEGGQSMADYYRQHLQGASQEEIFRFVTKSWADSIHVIKGDSARSASRRKPVLLSRSPTEITIRFGSRMTFVCCGII